MIGNAGKEATWWGSVVVIVVAAGLAATALLGGGGGAFHGTPPGGAGTTAPPGGRPTEGGNGLEATPSSWQMPAGSSVNLSAYLAPTAQDCIPFAVLLTWQVVGATSYLGYLNATAGAHVQFTSFLYGSGLAEVSVAGLGLALCGTSTEVFQAQTVVPISVLTPMSLGGLQVTPDPALPQQSVTLTVPVQGGVGPYRATFLFGDGGSQVVTAPDPSGLFALHAYPAGSFDPSVTVADALGETALEAATGPLLVSPALTVVISGPATNPEVGLVFPLVANVTGGEPPYAIVWNDSLGRAATGTVWPLVPTEAGPDTVTVRVTDSLGSTTTSHQTIQVEAALNVSAVAVRTVVDLGHPLPFTVAIDGGSGPFSVAVTALPSGSGLDLANVPARSFSEALVPTATGQLWVQVSVADALGAEATTIVPLAQVEPLPRLNLTVSQDTIEAGTPISLVGLASGGSPPYAWALASTSGVQNGSTPSTGGPAGSGLFAWSGTVVGTGETLFEVTATDAAGVVVQANDSLVVVSALHLSVRATAQNATVNHTDSVEALVSGGEPPYELLFTSSDGQSHATNLSGPAPAIWAWSPDRAGTFTVSVEVADGLGRFAVGNLSIPVPAVALAAVPPGSGTPTDPPPSGGGSTAPPTVTPTPSPAPSPAPSSALSGDFAGGFGAAAGLGLMALVGWVLLRGRFGRAPGRAGPSSRDLTTVGRLLRENEGIDRETLLFLAESEGLDENAVDRAVGRLRRLGRVTAEVDPDGQECFRSSVRAVTATSAAPPDGTEGAEGLP